MPFRQVIVLWESMIWLPRRASFWRSAGQSLLELVLRCSFSENTRVVICTFHTSDACTLNHFLVNTNAIIHVGHCAFGLLDREPDVIFMAEQHLYPKRHLNFKIHHKSLSESRTNYTLIFQAGTEEINRSTFFSRNICDASYQNPTCGSHCYSEIMIVKALHVIIMCTCVIFQ